MSSVSQHRDTQQVEAGRKLPKPWDRPKTRRHEIEKLGTDVMARGVKRAEIEAKIQQIRTSMKQDEKRDCDDAITTNSSCTTSTDSELSSFDCGSSQSSSHRDVLRRTLREKEKRINNILKRNTDIVYETRMRHLQIDQLTSAVEEKVAFTKELQRELEEVQTELECFKLKAIESMNLIEAPGGRIEIIQKQLEEKDEQIDYYEFKLRTKDKEAQHLRLDLADNRRRLVELEVMIETHDFRYSSQEELRRRLDKDDLEDMFEPDLGREESVSYNRLCMEKLVSDFDEMEKRYVQAKVEGTMHVAALEEEMKNAHKKIISFEKQIRSYRSNGMSNDTQEQFNGTPEEHLSVSQSHVHFLKKKLEVVESENVEYSHRIQELQNELKQTKGSADSQNHKPQKELFRLRLENDAFLTKIAALEVELSVAARHFDAAERCKRYNHLEKKLDDNVVEILRLEDKLSVKDRIISVLRSQAVHERLSLHLEATPDIKSFSAEPLDAGRMYAGSDDQAGSSCISDLQSQLSDARSQLSERDEELRLVRARSAARIAELRARMEFMQPKEETIPVVDLYFI